MNVASARAHQRQPISRQICIHLLGNCEEIRDKEMERAKKIAPISKYKYDDSVKRADDDSIYTWLSGWSCNQRRPHV